MLISIITSHLSLFSTLITHCHTRHFFSAITPTLTELHLTCMQHSLPAVNSLPRLMLRVLNMSLSRIRYEVLKMLLSNAPTLEVLRLGNSHVGMDSFCCLLPVC